MGKPTLAQATLLSCLGLASLALGAAATDTGTAELELIAPTDVEHKQNLHFGRILMRTGHRIVSEVDHLDNGSHSYSGVQQPAVGVTSGHFHVKGQPGKPYTVSLDPNFHLTGTRTRTRLSGVITHVHVPRALMADRAHKVGTPNILFNSAPGPIGLHGFSVVKIGGSLEVPDGTPSDAYEGTYQITVQFL
jgi:spore coat protein U-like protein